MPKLETDQGGRGDASGEERRTNQKDVSPLVVLQRIVLLVCQPDTAPLVPLSVDPASPLSTALRYRAAQRRHCQEAAVATTSTWAAAATISVRACSDDTTTSTRGCGGGDNDDIDEGLWRRTTANTQEVEAAALTTPTPWLERILYMY